MMPKGEQMLASNLSSYTASSLKTPTSALVGKAYVSVGQAGA